MPSIISTLDGDTMELRISHEEGYVLAKTAGTIDDDAREFLRGSLHLLVGQSGTKVVLDLSQSNFMNSNGIGQFVSLVTHANSSDSRVVLGLPRPECHLAHVRNKVCPTGTLGERQVCPLFHASHERVVRAVRWPECR